VNGVFGELIIDGILPTMFSGILVAGDSLFSISLSSLVVPICAVVGVVLYLVYLYRPARKARNQRLEIKKHFWDQADIKPPPKISKRALAEHTNSVVTLTENFKRSLAAPLRALRVAYMYLQNIVVRYSIDGYNRRLKMKRSRVVTWQTMNIPPYFQGYHNDRNGEESSMWNKYILERESDGFIPPMEIASMLLSRKWKEFYLNEAKKVSKDEAKISNNIQEMVVFKSKGEIKNYELKAAIIFEFPEALSLICSSFGTSLFVSISDFTKVLGDIWDVFYPDGVIMTEIERRECLEAFDLWRSEERLLYKDILVSSVLTRVEVISVAKFKYWFLDIFSKKLSVKKTDRLLDHVSCIAKSLKQADQVVSLPVVSSQKSSRRLSHSVTEIVSRRASMTDLSRRSSAAGLALGISPPGASPSSRRASMTNLARRGIYI
jgi:hypothetical protein